MLIIKNLNFGFKDQKLLDTAFSGEFNYGNFIALIGRNGSGKSTFLKQLAGLDNVVKDTLFIENQDYINLSRTELARKVCWAGTDKNTFEYLSVYEFIALGRHPHLGWGGILSKEDKQIIEHAISTLNIEHLSIKYLSACSDGEKQSALLARMLVQSSPVILLDEITAHLDFVHRKNTFQLLQSISKNENKLVILATHEIDLSLKYCDEILLFHEKKIQRFKTSGTYNNSILSDVFEGYA
jgi:iron complex transport system ATP-binding protein